MSLSLLKIWSFPLDVAIASLKQLTDSGFKIRTNSESIHIQIISALTGTHHDFLPDLDNEIIADDLFLKLLEKAEHNDLNHDDIFIKAIQESDNTDLKRILYEQEKIKREAKEAEYAKRQTLLENTYNEKPDDICPLDAHDESNFYFTDPTTGEKVLLKAHHLFQYRQHCFDIDTIFRYINEGGHVPLEPDYIRRFFDKNGAIDMSDLGLTSEVLSRKVYHSDVRVMYLNNNNITTLRDSHLPSTLNILSINNNPLKGGYFLNSVTPKLTMLSMKDCNLDKVDCSYLPQSLKILNLSNNSNLTSLHSLSNMRNLQRLDIRNTGIKTIDWSKFHTLDPKKTMILMCDEGIHFKKSKPDWIIVKYVE